jgi:plastocyanin
MKTRLSILFAVAALFIANISFAQKVQTVKLDQAPGAFTTTSLNLKAGTYIFEVTNTGVDHEVGFVIAPKGKTEQENHITSAYVQKTIKDGESSISKEVTLSKGEYVYFCPMNPTPLYTLVVE